MKLLTKEQLESYENIEVLHNIEYTGEYRGAAHSIYFKI